MAKKAALQPLPTPAELLRCADCANRRLNRLFTRPDLKHLAPYRAIGLRRLRAKRDVALMLAAHMQAQGIRSVEALADVLFIGHDHFEALYWMRYPLAFRCVQPNHAHNRYLVELCNLEWDHRTKRWSPSKNAAL